MRYASARHNSGKVRLHLNGSLLEDLGLAATAGPNTWTNHARKVFLTGGINRIVFAGEPDGSSEGLRIDSLDVTPAAGTITEYEAEDSANTIGGAAKIEDNGGASGAKVANAIGAGSANFLQFNNIAVPAAGTYRMVVSYSNNEKGHAGQVERYAQISANGEESQKIYFRNTYQWSIFGKTVVDVHLQAGKNAIRFSNSSAGLAPEIDKIQIAAPIATD